MYYIYFQSVRKRMKIFVSIALSFLLLSCSKFEIEEVGGNKPPTEQIVTAQLRESYINRLYITLAGRKASPQEFEASLQLLGENAHVADRKKVILSIFSMPEYYHELYAIARSDYLESVDTTLIGNDHRTAELALTTASGRALEYWTIVELQLRKLLEIPKLLQSAQIDLNEVHRRLVNNPYYDDINMGSENYVVATFQNFLFRYPTNVELESARKMVDGFPASLFLLSGNSRNDFIDIFFSSDDYYEGQVINLFRKYLFRDADSAEMFELTNALQASGDYQNLQLTLLSSDDYFFN